MISRKSVHISVTQSSTRAEVYKQYSTNIYMKEKITKFPRSKQVVQVLDSQPVCHPNKLHYNSYSGNQLKLTFSSSVSSNISLYSLGKITFFKYIFWSITSRGTSHKLKLKVIFVIHVLHIPDKYTTHLSEDSLLWILVAKVWTAPNSYDKYSLTKTARATGTKVWKMLWTP